MLEPGKRGFAKVAAPTSVQLASPSSTSSSSSSCDSGSASSSRTSSNSTTPTSGSPDNFKGCPRVAAQPCKRAPDGGLVCTLPPPPMRELPEWIETDSIDGEISGLVVGQRATNGPMGSRSRRCCKNSTSSGYSSHSPPLSATSYATGPPAPAPANGGPNAGKALAPIHEGKIIPRPIWPAVSGSDDSSRENSSPETASSDVGRDGNRRQPSLYGCTEGYRSSSCEAGSGSSSDYGGGSGVSAREVLLELSRTLSSVLEGDCDKSDEEILRDITRTVSVVQAAGSVQGANTPGQDGRRASSTIYEEIYRNNASSLASSARESSSTIGVNPINSRLYGHRCYCEKRSFLYQNLAPSVHQSPKQSGRKDQCVPNIFLLPNDHPKSPFQGIENGFVTCNCRGYGGEAQEKLGLKKSAAKQSRGQTDTRTEKDNVRFNYPSMMEHEYTTLECSDECSSTSAGSGADSKNNTWCRDFRGFDKNLDFTLDGLRAERLGREIARAKRRRRWCCVIVVLLGLVFFVLSVVVVSLSVTKGRKVFGSM